MTAQLTFDHGDNAARDAADLCGRAQLRILESTRDDDRDRRSRWSAAHILFMTAVGLANHPRSFAGIRFDERGIAEWRLNSERSQL